MQNEEFRLPEIGAGQHAIRVVQWLVDVGSEVYQGDRLLEVAATGVLFVVSAPCTGVLVEQHIGVDSIVTTGEALGTIDCAPPDE